MPRDETESGTRSSRAGWYLRLALLLTAIALAVIAYWQWGDWLSLQRLAQHQQNLEAYRDQHWWWVIGAAFIVYVVVTGASLPGAAVLTLVLAWFLGFWPALILVSFASTFGATLAFLLSRFLFRAWVQDRLGERWELFDRRLQQEGAFYLFSLRLIPTVPFFVINLAMGPTRIPWWTFWWVSQIGMLPGTIAYVWAGSAAPDLQTLADKGVTSILTAPLIAAFLFLALVPWLGKGLVAWWRSGAGRSTPKPPTAGT